MPKVGKKKFSYTKAGKAAAKEVAKRTGKTMRKSVSKIKPNRKKSKKKYLFQFHLLEKSKATESSFQYSKLQRT